MNAFTLQLGDLVDGGATPTLIQHRLRALIDQGLPHLVSFDVDLGPGAEVGCSLIQQGGYFLFSDRKNIAEFIVRYADGERWDRAHRAVFMSSRKKVELRRPVHLYTRSINYQLLATVEIHTPDLSDYALEDTFPNSKGQFIYDWQELEQGWRVHVYAQSTDGSQSPAVEINKVDFFSESCSDAVFAGPRGQFVFSFLAAIHRRTAF